MYSNDFSWGAFFAAEAMVPSGLVSWGCGPADVAKVWGGRPVYLATPYSKIVGEVGALTFPSYNQLCADRAACRLDALRRSGVTGISPILQAAQMVLNSADAWANALDATLWARWCQPLLNVCSCVVVPDTTGWDDSDGIRHEVIWAVNRNVPVLFYAQNPALSVGDAS